MLRWGYAYEKYLFILNTRPDLQVMRKKREQLKTSDSYSKKKTLLHRKLKKLKLELCGRGLLSWS